MTPSFENYPLILTPEGHNDPQFLKPKKTLYIMRITNTILVNGETIDH